MKKLLALFLAALFVFSTATLFVSAASPKPVERDDKNIVKMDLLDFNAESNALWAKQDENGEWYCFIEPDNWEYPQDPETYATIAPYITSSYRNNTRFSFIENGEVLRFEVTGSNGNPGLAFVLDESHNEELPVGRESGDNPKAEYFKIRVRNHSTAAKFSFGFALNQTNSYKFVSATVSDLKVDKDGKEYKSASGEWETYIFSMATINQATNYDDLLPKDSDGNPYSRWGGLLSDLLLFPFGYGVTDGTGPYIGASIDIDYVVMGSLDYVTNYKSTLEQKEESITSLELVSKPDKLKYYVGESLDLEGLKLKAKYSDGTEEILTSASYTVNLEVGNSAAPVTLTFGKESVQFNVEVVGVSSIELEKTADDTTYELSEVANGFVPTGYTFKVNYTDGTSRTDLPIFLFNCYLNDSASAGRKTVTANFYGITTTFEIDVINVTDLEITAPEKEYYYKDIISSDDFTINFVYNDGTKIASGSANTELEYTVDVNNKAAGEVIAKITAKNDAYGINITKEVAVTFKTPTALSVTSDPIKKVYQVGETFNADGMTISLVYEDGKTIALLDNDADTDKDSEKLTIRANTTKPGDVNVSVKFNREGFEDLKLAEKYSITVEGDANTDDSTTTKPANTTRAPQGGNSSGGVSPVVIVIIIVAVVVVAGVAVVLVVLKKKKK